MAWFSFSDKRGRGWEFDPEGAARVLRQCHYNRLVVERARFVQTDHGFGLPTTTAVEVDFSGIREDVYRRAAVVATTLPGEVLADPREMFDFLVAVRRDGEVAGDAYHRMMRRASQATSDAISRSVGIWENAVSAAKFVRDTSAGVLFVGATVLSGGTALAVGGTGAGLTFAGNTQDSLAKGQSLSRSIQNATVATSIAVITSVLIPRGLGAAHRAMTGATRATMKQGIAMGLVQVQASLVGDVVKTALTPDDAAEIVANQASTQLARQVGARSAFEIGSMLFGAWLQSRGIPASAFLKTKEHQVSAALGGALSALGDRFVSAASQKPSEVRRTDSAPNLDLALTAIERIVEAETYVRRVALRPASVGSAV